MKDPKKYAEELVDKMRLSSLKMSKKDAVNCALIAVDEIMLDELEIMPAKWMHDYWHEVKSELEKL